MHHVMFDIDGTLVESNDLDALCFQHAVEEVTGISVSTDWSSYRHVTDAGIVMEVLQRNSIVQIEEAEKRIKEVFITALRDAFLQEPVIEVPGAASFLQVLKRQSNVSISLATGGWLQSALLKLSSAGIDITDIPIASSDDHHVRTRILEIARSRLPSGMPARCTYFGDGPWDKEACEELQYDFIAVGKNVEHRTAIENYVPIPAVLKLLDI